MIPSVIYTVVEIYRNRDDLILVKILKFIPRYVFVGAMGKVIGGTTFAIGPIGPYPRVIRKSRIGLRTAIWLGAEANLRKDFLRSMSSERVFLLS